MPECSQIPTFKWRLVFPQEVALQLPHFKPSFYRRHFDDIFVLFEWSECVDSFFKYTSSKQQNISFTDEQENISSVSFSDVKICRKNGNVSLTFTENQHLVLFSPTTKVSFERSKSEDFYTHYFIGVLAFVMNFILTFILKFVIWRLSL